MELSWVNKMRIGAVAALGIVVIGLLAWPLAAPADPLGPVRSTDVSFPGTMLLLLSALLVGFAGFFIAWPHGREIGILGVPFGLAVWALRSGSMSVLTQAANEPAERQALLASLWLEPVYWLLIIAAGFVGVLAAQCAATKSLAIDRLTKFKACLTPNIALMSALALLAAALIAQFFIGVFAQNLTTQDDIATQPAVGQIVFATVGAFAVAGFAVKKFFALSYLWAALATVFVLPVSILTRYSGAKVEEFAQLRPATFFPHAVFGLLPLQLVAFGAIGSVIGYWMAVRYDHWRQHEATA